MESFALAQCLFGLIALESRSREEDSYCARSTEEDSTAVLSGVGLDSTLIFRNSMDVYVGKLASI